ncbi:helix-turn-helix domain-containing protein [Planosporangium thailandense]|uniref:Helix-turn-helix domain-containing protein n=1 Tax=Planosporangium thailandense TaxID=765197 RepID=A0ABX0Y7G7_9ACTN|nr:helix-turn-helix domain-containing protein [Planosporangium thailandense]
MIVARTGDSAVVDDQVVESLGRRVARTRHAAELTLAAVAQRADVSAAYISQIESATANPTVRSLARIAAAMGVSVGELFGSTGDDQLPTPRFEPRFATAPRAALTPGASGIWDLTAAGSARIFARLVHGEPGDHADPVSHPGEEFVAVLAGRCHLRVGDRVRELKAFDACHFAASDPHHITDVSDDLLLLVILTEE